MTDITTLWDAASGRGDWLLSAGALAEGDDLTTAVLISLFSDRRAGQDDLISDGSGDARGWWGDTGEDYPIGSRLWLLMRRKADARTLADARDYLAEALAWLTADGVAARVDVATEWARPGVLGARVSIVFQDGAARTLNFAWVWGIS